MHSIAEEVTIKHHARTGKHHELEEQMQRRINELERQLNLPPWPPVTLNENNKFERLNENTSGMPNGTKAVQLHDPNDVV